MSFLRSPLGLVLVVHAVMSAATFVVYGFDKSRAIRGGRRVPERTLHLLALFGGWPGALVAASVLRHKTIKLSFRLVTAAIVALHLAAWYFTWRAGWWA